MTIGINCQRCGVSGAKCEVPERGAEDVTIWLEQAIYLATLEHRRLSPACVAQTLDLVIPFDGSSRVGAPVLH